ncbi:MAG: substrate-binding domain-containing protein, partial [Rhodocyclaceae bacterium]|nr:substrate-binding domain-containing protein [Rhodocyclaceae bacterium]
PALIEGFARRNGLVVAQELVDGTLTYRLSDRTSGRLKGRFRLHLSNTDEGFADLLADEADVALALREIRKSELAHGEAAGLGDMSARGRARVLALDALVAVVAPENPVRRISITDLARVFAGEIDNWQTLGGPDAPISLHIRDERSGLGQTARDRLLGPAQLTLAPGAILHESDAALAAALARDPFGIGLASYAARGE